MSVNSYRVLVNIKRYLRAESCTQPYSLYFPLKFFRILLIKTIENHTYMTKKTGNICDDELPRQR